LNQLLPAVIPPKEVRFSGVELSLGDWLLAVDALFRWHPLTGRFKEGRSPLLGDKADGLQLYR